MSDFHQRFVNTLSERRTHALSLSKSYQLARQYAGVNSSDPSLANIQVVSNQLVLLIESDGLDRAEQGAEPAYHNRNILPMLY